jgi:hypothetical protein
LQCHELYINKKPEAARNAWKSPSCITVHQSCKERDGALGDEVLQSQQLSKIVNFTAGMMMTSFTTAQPDPILNTNLDWAALLPPAPMRLLLLGEQTETAFTDLASMGYQLHVCAPHSGQTLVQYPTYKRQPLYELDVPTPESPQEYYDAAVVVGLSPQMHPLAMWDQLAQCLADDAPVVLVRARANENPPRMRHWLNYVVAIGARCGFKEHRNENNLATECKDWSVCCLSKSTPPRWEIRHVRSKDFAEIAKLFHEVFGHELSFDLWNWKYANGRGNAVAATRDSTLIAHYGGIYRDVMLCGERDWVFQICDVMVHPKERGVMTRNGPFLLTAATSAEMYGPLGFGFPNDRHAVLAEKVGVGTSMGEMSMVRWEPASPRSRLRSHIKALTRSSADGNTIIAPLWEAMAEDLRDGVVGVRDWEYLVQRYLNHPHNQYELLIVVERITGRSLGAMVLRRLDATCELLDVIAPMANLAVVIDQARRLTAMWRLESLYCWITKNHVERFLDCGGRNEELNITIPNSSWTNDPRAEVFRDKWWLMSGDTDFR